SPKGESSPTISTSPPAVASEAAAKGDMTLPPEARSPGVVRHVDLSFSAESIEWLAGGSRSMTGAFAESEGQPSSTLSLYLSIDLARLSITPENQTGFERTTARPRASRARSRSTPSGAQGDRP